ncbi:MAG: N-acyl-D-amino-acid deacylase family protein [Nitrospinota bacterium]
MFDLIIKNGLVIDGISTIPNKKDIAIQGDLIVDIADSIDRTASKESIDADGMLVTPGFVDLHSHSDYYLLIDNRASSRLSQGVTTDIGGNCGYGAAPIGGEILQERLIDYKKKYNLELDFESVRQYSDRLTKIRSGINLGLLLGYNTIRASISGYKASRLSADEESAVARMISAGLDEGAIGMSVGLVYPPASFSKLDELIKAFQIVGSRGKIFTAHIRSEGDQLEESIKEVLLIAREAGCKLQISHLKTAGKNNWDKLESVFEIIEEAKANGQEVMADRYPYLAANTSLSVILPDWTFEGGRSKLLERLGDEPTRRKIKNQILQIHTDDNYFDSIWIAHTFSKKNSEYEGLSISESARLAGKEEFDFICDLLIEEEGNVEAIYFMMNEENLNKIYQKEWVFVASDSGASSIDGPLSDGKPHPRGFGSFAKFWSRYVIDKKALNYVEAINKMSVYPCKFFNIQNRGLIAKNKVADIAIFDPNNFKDQATYADPQQYATGLMATIVNGKIAYKENKVTDALAGKMLHF